MSYYVIIMSIKTFTVFRLLCHIMSCVRNELLYQLCHYYYVNFFLRLLCKLCQLKLNYVTYFKSDLLYQLFISTVIIAIIFFDAIKTIIQIKHINSRISFSIYYIYYFF